MYNKVKAVEYMLYVRVCVYVTASPSLQGERHWRPTHLRVLLDVDSLLLYMYQ